MMNRPAASQPCTARHYRKAPPHFLSFLQVAGILKTFADNGMVRAWLLETLADPGAFIFRTNHRSIRDFCRQPLPLPSVRVLVKLRAVQPSRMMYIQPYMS